MKKIFILLLISSCIFLNSCDDDKNPTGPSGNSPQISNLIFSPSEANVGDGGGEVTVKMNLDFTDQDGDVKALFVNSNVSNMIVDLTGNEDTNGTINDIPVTINTTKKKDIVIEVWVIDGKENSSNKVSGIFLVK